MSNPARSVKHSTTKLPAEVAITRPLLSGQVTADGEGVLDEATVDVGTGAGDEAADGPDAAGSDDVAVEAAGEVEEPDTSLAPQTLPLVFAFPAPSFR
jgi:hypothetical protein